MFVRSRVPAFIGVIHLPPLPGSPRQSPGYSTIEQRAIADATTLRDGGADGVIIENFGDAPFAKDEVCASTIATMARLSCRIREVFPRGRLGINVLRNDALAALGIASACDADFIRVNVFTGVSATDQGIIEGKARALHLERQRLDAEVKFAADVHVKHASSMYQANIEQAAEDNYRRGLADAIILSGSGTGVRTPNDSIRRVRKVLPDAPIWIGSGFTPEQLDEVRGVVDAVVVGTWLRNSDLAKPILMEHVQTLRSRLDR